MRCSRIHKQSENLGHFPGTLENSAEMVRMRVTLRKMSVIAHFTSQITWRCPGKFNLNVYLKKSIGLENTLEILISGLSRWETYS